jgi:hypothetical protein
MPPLIQITGNALRGFQRAANEARSTCLKSVTEVAYRTQRQARENVRRLFKSKPPPPGQRVTSNLAPSIVVVKLNGGMSAAVGSNAIHARIREEGGTIVPIHKKWLSWLTTDPLKGDSKSWSGRSKKSVQANIGAGAHRVFAKKVTQRGKPYLRPALEQVQRERAGENVIGALVRDLNAGR